MPFANHQVRGIKVIKNGSNVKLESATSNGMRVHHGKSVNLAGVVSGRIGKVLNIITNHGGDAPTQFY